MNIITSSYKLILEELKLNSKILRDINPLSKRTHYRAVINWLTKFQPRELNTWGYYRQPIELYKKLLEKLNSEVDLICLNGLTLAYTSLADYAEAIKYSERHLEIAREIGNHLEEAKALGNLGTIYCIQSNLSKAIEYLEKSLEIFQQIGDKEKMGDLISNLFSPKKELKRFSICNPNKERQKLIRLNKFVM